MTFWSIKFNDDTVHLWVNWMENISEWNTIFAPNWCVNSILAIQVLQKRGQYDRNEIKLKKSRK